VELKFENSIFLLKSVNKSFGVNFQSSFVELCPPNQNEQKGNSPFLLI